MVKLKLGWSGKKEDTTHQHMEWGRNITVEPTDITRAVTGYQCQILKCDGLEEMNKSPTRRKLPKHTEEETDNLISLIPIKGIEFVADKFLNKAWCSHLQLLSYTEESMTIL